MDTPIEKDENPVVLVDADDMRRRAEAQRRVLKVIDDTLIELGRLRGRLNGLREMVENL